MSKQTRTHILVVSQYFYPEQFRINDICCEWVKRGYKVTVLTGIPNYPTGRFFDGYGFCRKRTEVWNGVQIIRIPLIPRGKTAVGLMLNYASFVVSGFFWKIFTSIDADYVFNYEVSPMTQVLIGCWYAKRKKIPNYLYLTDLWPDNVEITTDIHSPMVIRPINWMTNSIYKRCDKIFTSSRSFTNKLVERNVCESKLEFWPQYAEEFYRPMTREEMAEIPRNKFNIMFAGNIGYAQGLGTLIDTAKLLKKDGLSVRFDIVGDGRYKNELVNNVKLNNLDDYFNFIERRPAEEIPRYMAAADAALISLSKSKVFAMTIPAKTQSIMACGKPILVAADGEIQNVIKEAGCGYVCGALDSLGLYNNIKTMLSLSEEELLQMGKNARRNYEKNFEKKMLMDRMDKYFQ